MTILRLTMILSLLLSGCSVGAPSLSTHRSNATLALMVRPYLVAPQRVQTLVSALTLADVKTIAIVPRVDPGDGTYRLISHSGEPLEAIEELDGFSRWDEIVQASVPAETLRLDRPIALYGLKAHRRYRISAVALDGAGNVLSKQGSVSSVEVTLTNDDAPTIETPLPLELLDTPFGAKGTVRIEASGRVSRLAGVDVSLIRLQDGQEDLQPVATQALAAAQLPITLTFSHLRANTHYVVRVEPKVADGDPAPQAQTIELSVANDDELPPERLLLEVP